MKHNMKFMPDYASLGQFMLNLNQLNFYQNLKSVDLVDFFM